VIHNAVTGRHRRSRLVRLVAGPLLAGALALTGGTGVASAAPRVTDLVEQLYDLQVGTECLAQIRLSGGNPVVALGALKGPRCSYVLGKGASRGLALFECMESYTAATCVGLPPDSVKNDQGASLDRYSGPPGTTVTARGSGFAPNKSVRVTQTGGPGVTGGGGNTQGDGNGNVSMNFRVADGTPPGTITIWFRQSDNIIANTKFEVTGPREAG
jgi:hypothetical protein